MTQDTKIAELVQKVRFCVAEQTQDLNEDDRKAFMEELGLGQFTRADLLKELASRYNAFVFGGIVWTAQEDGGVSFANEGPSVLQAGLVHHLDLITKSITMKGWERQ